MSEPLRETCRKLLAEGTVQVVIGYGESAPGGPAYPIFVTRPEDCDRLVWNDRCFANLTTYLKRPEIRAMGRPAVVVKGCDARALVVLEQESQIDRAAMVAVGVACYGVGHPIEPKCAACDLHVPRHVDVVVGEVNGSTESREGRYDELEALRRLSTDERIAFWQEQLSRCVKCYACRQVCPLCYCERCIADKNRPQAIDSSPSLKGNFAWHITRAFHLAGRCVGCDECTRVCPAGIDLRLLNLSLAQAAETQFGFRAGMDPAGEPIVGAYSQQDKETFIR
jgi:ferredoxin